MFFNEPIDISAEAWTDLLLNPDITQELDKKILKVIYESRNHEARASEIAAELNLAHHIIVNRQVGSFSNRVVSASGITPPFREKGTPRWWHVPFLGYEKEGHFPWIMRAELVSAYENVFGPTEKELLYTEETVPEKTVNLSEGAVSQVYINRYERNSRAKAICIEHHGSKCSICCFDFGKVYGSIGKDKIHVHHLVPLSTIKQDYKLEPEHDLRPVCPNCHFIIHSKKEPFTIEEVRELIRRRTSHIQ